MKIKMRIAEGLGQLAQGVLMASLLVLVAETGRAAPADLDPLFGPVLDLPVYSMAVQPDQKIIIAGAFTSVNGTMENQVARLNTDGSLDTSFISGLSGIGGLPCLALQNDGKVLVAAMINSEYQVARLNSDGSLDDSFAQGSTVANSPIYSLLIQNDGRILVAGAFTTFNGFSKSYLVRLNPDGSLDPSFFQGMTGPSAAAVCTVQDVDGRILVGGYFTTVNGEPRSYIARLNTDGSLDHTFLNGLDGPNLMVGGLAIQTDGKILIGGRFRTVNGQSATNVARLFANGSLDISFQCCSLPFQMYGGFYYATLVLLQDGKLLVLAKHFPLIPASQNLYQLNSDGSLDNQLTDVPVWSAVPQADGKLLVSGRFSTINQTTQSYIARLMGEYAPPTVSALPEGVTAEAGGSVRFAAAASGFSPLVYQWYFNGTHTLGGCTNRCLELSDISPENCGIYTLVVSNADGVVTSSPISLSVIPKVNRRSVPAINIAGVTGSALTIESADSLTSPVNWVTLDTLNLTNSSQFYCDSTDPLPSSRFYRAWQPETVTPAPSLNLPGMIPAIPLSGNIGDTMQLDCINVIGPTNAWTTLTTIILTNASQLYFDLSSLGQPARLYRILSAP